MLYGSPLPVNSFPDLMAMAEKATITVENLRCNKKGLTRLGALASALQRHRGKKISIDCTLVSWIDANLAAALGGLIGQEDLLYESKIEFSNLRSDVRDALVRTGLLVGKSIDRYGTCIPLTMFGDDEAKDHAAFSTKHLNGRSIPPMTDGVMQKFFEGIDEIFNNSTIHSKSIFKILVCGQIYPGKKLIDYTIVDLGVGFKEAIDKHLDDDISPCAAIEWAMKENNTTRGLDMPGGLGLGILKDFVVLNRSYHRIWCLNI